MATRADVDRIVDLAACIDAIEFAEPEPQRSKLGMYAVGGAPGLYEQSRYKKSGLIYRKRDALADGFKGGAVGNSAMAATLGGAVGAGALASKRMLPKGALRKAGVAAGQFVKKSPVAALVGAGAIGPGAGMATMHHSAENRRKGLLKQRLAGAGA